jgi:hypothetical protein
MSTFYVRTLSFAKTSIFYSLCKKAKRCHVINFLAPNIFLFTQAIKMSIFRGTAL